MGHWKLKKISLFKFRDAQIIMANNETIFIKLNSRKLNNI